MRLFLALMAVVALLVSPVAAAAAQYACDGNSASGRSAMAMPSMPEAEPASAHQSSADPCCDHGGTHKMDAKSCALACATSCAATAVLPCASPVSELAFSATQLTPARSDTPRPYEPSRLIRPPKSMA
jgi:hypothetical protein